MKTKRYIKNKNVSCVACHSIYELKIDNSNCCYSANSMAASCMFGFHDHQSKISVNYLLSKYPETSQNIENLQSIN